MVRFLLALILSLGVFAAPASAWWQKDYAYRKPVVIDTSPSGLNVSGSIGTTLVLVRLSSGNFNFTDVLDNGADIRFIDRDDKTPLTYHVDSFDAKTGVATIWVSVPALTGGEKRQIWLYFGNKAAAVGEDIKGSFDADTIAAFHFSDSPGQASADRTAYGNNASNAPPSVDDGAIIGRAARFPGEGAISVPASASLALPAAAPFTLTAWIKPDQIAGDAAIMARGSLVVGLAAGVPYVAVGETRIAAAAAVRPAAWTHVGIVADGASLRLYVNGIEAAAAAAALPAQAEPLTIGGAGAAPDGSPDARPFTGTIDEVRLAKTARPAAMLLVMATAEGPEGNRVVSVSDTAERQGSGGGGVLFFVASKLEGLDVGIVGICMVLLAGAIAVMVTKARYLGASERGNAVFMKRFAAMRDNLVPVADIPGISAAEIDYIARAPLGRLYNTGIDEYDRRRMKLGSRAMSAQAVDALRASVDAAAMQENQKLDRWMVLLTIAISGGPFIGLLGTVIGVMSTFGGVALAGDVNVNAIAPGIAAALLATIAGLAAAIPSLFGYNYLNSRIGVISDAMTTFVDQLVTRFAELQADAVTPPPARLAAE
jgi:biopolymer transport protein ExbB